MAALTTSNGNPVDNNQQSTSLGARGPLYVCEIAGALSIMGVFLRESGITREMSTERDARADGGWNEVHHALGESPHESESDREEAKERESGTRGGASKER